MKHIVYKTINTINDKYYIGVHSTLNINDNYIGCGHWRGRKIYSNATSPILKAFLKYGDNNFVRETLFMFDKRETALLKERELININDINCYNARGGGDSNYVYTEEVKKKMSESAKTRSKLYSLQTELLTEHVKNRVGKTYIEIYGEEKAREIISKKSNSAKGRKHSDTARERMSVNRKGKDCGKCKGRKRVYDITNNKIVRLFPEQIQLLIQEGKVKKEEITITKFLKAKYIFTSC